MISRKEILHIAKLSRLEFDQNQLNDFEKDLNTIIEYVNELQNVDTSSLKTELNPIDAKTQLRDDVVVQSFTQNQSVQNAPDKKNGAFVVPTVIE